MTYRSLPILALTLSLAAALPAGAQDAEAETPPDSEDGFSEGLDLLRDGSRLIFENLIEEMRPMMEEVQPFLEDEMLPFLNRLGELVDDLSVYEMPERLPNGDIIIRRREDAPAPDMPDSPNADPETETPDDPVDL